MLLVLAHVSTPPEKSIQYLGIKTVSNSSKFIDSIRSLLSLLFIILLVLMLKAFNKEAINLEV